MNNDLTKQDVENLQKSIDRVEKKMDNALNEFRLDLKKIEMYLYNDSDTDTMGVIQQVKDHEKRLNGIEEEGRVRKRVIATIGIIAGLVGTAFLELIRWMLSKS